MFFGVLIITIVYVPISPSPASKANVPPDGHHGHAGAGRRPGAGAHLMPVLCSYLLTGSIREGDNALVRAIKGLYQPSLRLVLAKPW
jgi:cobalt-zinc-cadmium resistance protein CzcA